MKILSSQTKAKSLRGFSLVELLVSTAVLAIIGSLLLQFSNNITSSITKTSSSLKSLEAVQSLSAQLESDAKHLRTSQKTQPVILEKDKEGLQLRLELREQPRVSYAWSKATQQFTRSTEVEAEDGANDPAPVLLAQVADLDVELIYNADPKPCLIGLKLTISKEQRSEKEFTEVIVPIAG
jgi:prepilin-type N-terminal cleavage/methylation domain-containing protein